MKSGLTTIDGRNHSISMKRSDDPNMLERPIEITACYYHFGSKLFC